MIHDQGHRREWDKGGEAHRIKPRLDEMDDTMRKVSRIARAALFVHEGLCRLGPCREPCDDPPDERPNKRREEGVAYKSVD